MVVAARAETLLYLYRKAIPKVYRQIVSMKGLLTSPGGLEQLNGQFTGLPTFGFSKTILEQNANAFVLSALKVLPGAIGEIKIVLLVIFQEWEWERRDS